MRQILLTIGVLFCAAMVFAQGGPTYSHETIASGNWSSESTWADGNVPLIGGTATVGIHHGVVLDTYVYVQSVNVLTGGTLSCSSDNRLGIAENGSFGCAAGTSTTFTLGSLLLMGSASLDNAGGTATVAFYDVTVCLGTVALGGVTINGTLTVQGGTISSPPVYGPSSILKYFSGEAYTAGAEWATNISSGTGVPANVHVQCAATIPATGSHHVLGELSARSGGVLDLNGIVSIGGNLSLGDNTIGYGTINCNFALVKFVGAGDQTIAAEKRTHTLRCHGRQAEWQSPFDPGLGHGEHHRGCDSRLRHCRCGTAATLMIDDAGSISGDGDAFVDGSLTIKKSGGGMAWFPLGDGSAYRPMRATVNGSNCLMVGRMVNQGYTATGTGIDGVSPVRHWEFGYISGTFEGAVIELNYGADDGVTDPGNLRVAKVEPMFNAATDLGGMGNGTTTGFIVTDSYVPGVWDFLCLANGTGGTNYASGDTDVVRRTWRSQTARP